MIKDNVGFVAQDLRHPIIERINDKFPYVANDVELNGSGMLLYGVNSSGKSSLMKSIGLATIMAQAGMYVPAGAMEFTPFDHIFTRIPAGDDIFKGQSTFVKEMCELRNIFRRATDRSLVIGDECCFGTESISATSIVAAGIHTLAKRRACFVFATHLHTLMDIEQVTSLENLKVYHLEVIYDRALKTLVYNRKLTPGSGSSVYGLEVCRSLNMDPEFMDLAETIRDGLSRVELKNSVYNKDLVVGMCEVCKKEPAEEVHHIRQQKDADKEGFFESYHKNVKHNLVPLCEGCHHRVHRGELVIEGYIATGEGVRLQSRECASECMDLVKVVKETFEEGKRQFSKKPTMKWVIEKVKETMIGVSEYKIKKVLKQAF